MIDKASLPLDRPRRTPDHPTKSHVVKTKVDGKEKIIRFGEQGASTAGKPKAGESERMKAKRASFKARHAKNIAKGKSSPAYWADKVKWAEGGEVRTGKPPSPSSIIAELMAKVRKGQQQQSSSEFDILGVLSKARRSGAQPQRSPLTAVRATESGTPPTSSPSESAAPTAGVSVPQAAPQATPVSFTAPANRELPSHVLKSPYYAETVRLAEKYNLPTDVFVSLVNQESSFNPKAVSPKGAYGLTQLMPGTSKMLGGL